MAAMKKAIAVMAALSSVYQGVFMRKFFFASFGINFNRKAFIAFNNKASVDNIKSHFAEFPRYIADKVLY